MGHPLSTPPINVKLTLTGANSIQAAGEGLFFPGRMSDDRFAGIGQQLPKRLGLLNVYRVNDRQMVSGGDLDQAKLRTVAVFGHKLGVEGDQRTFSNLVTKLPQLIDRIYGLVVQRYAGVLNGRMCRRKTRL